MSRWKIHEKWCQTLGIKKSICQEINRIVDRPPHDIEDQLLRKKWVREAFESGKATTSFCIIPGDDIERLTTELAEITNRFGEEGIKATFNHIALDYIAELIELGFGKEEVREKLIEKELMNYISHYEQIFDDTSRETKPSPAKTQRKKEFEKLAKSGVHGIFLIDDIYLLPPVPALIHIKGKLKKGRAIKVKWGINADYARTRRGISKILYEMKDLEKLIGEIKSTSH